MCVESTSLSFPDSKRSRDSAPSAPEHETPDASPRNIRVLVVRNTGQLMTRMAPVSREDVDLRRGRGAIAGALPARRWRASRSRARNRSPSSTSSVPRTRRTRDRRSTRAAAGRLARSSNRLSAAALTPFVAATRGEGVLKMAVRAIAFA